MKYVLQAEAHKPEAQEIETVYNFGLLFENIATDIAGPFQLLMAEIYITRNGDYEVSESLCSSKRLHLLQRR